MTPPVLSRGPQPLVAFHRPDPICESPLCNESVPVLVEDEARQVSVVVERRKCTEEVRFSPTLVSDLQMRLGYLGFRENLTPFAPSFNFFNPTGYRREIPNHSQNVPVSRESMPSPQPPRSMDAGVASKDCPGVGPADDYSARFTILLNRFLRTLFSE